jgi:hypothetical protein
LVGGGEGSGPAEDGGAVLPQDPAGKAPLYVDKCNMAQATCRGRHLALCKVVECPFLKLLLPLLMLCCCLQNRNETLFYKVTSQVNFAWHPFYIYTISYGQLYIT